MYQTFIADAIRTPIGRYAGALSEIRTDSALLCRVSRLCATRLHCLLLRKVGIRISAAA